MFKNKNIQVLRTHLKLKLLNDTSTINYQAERIQIENLIQRTVENGESNSLLLIGPRGSGKTTIINNILDAKNDKDFQENSLVVKLHGLIHTNDNLALKSITAQLELENAVDGKVFGSFAENLAFLLACLRAGSRETSKSIIVILDDFDLFCAHHNQTLLYNLFDVSQSAQTPLCVIGLTCRLDVIELLEKRVKSRFSCRQIFLFPGENSNETQLDKCLKRIADMLIISSDFKIEKRFRNDWNDSINKLIKDKRFAGLLQRLLDIDFNERILRNHLLQMVCLLNDKKINLTFEDFNMQMGNFEKDHIYNFLQDMTVLELCLLIAMKHHCDIYDDQQMNFEMIYSRYIRFVNSNPNIQTVQRAVVMKAFEHIQDMELIFLVSQGTKVQKEYQMFKLLVPPQKILECVNKLSGLPTEVTQWVGSPII